MNAEEIIEAIKKLPFDEQMKMVAYFDALKRKSPREQKDPIAPEFKRIVGDVIKTHDELFRKLAEAERLERPEKSDSK